MVEVQVGEQQMDLARAAFGELGPQGPDPGAGVEDEDGAVLERDLHA